MKKRIWNAIAAALLSLTLFTCSASEAFAATPVDEAFMATNAFSSAAISAQVVQSTLYVLTEAKIVSYHAAQQGPETMIEMSNYPDIDWTGLLLTSDGNSLFALSPAQGILYQVDGTALREAVHLDISELGQERQEGLRYVIFDHPVVQDNHLFLLYLDPEVYGDKALYCFSMIDGKCRKIETGSRSLSEIAPYQNNRLVAVDYNTMELVSIDAESGSISSPFGSLVGYSDGATAYDAENDRLFFIHGTELMSLSNQRTEAVDYLPFDGAAGVTYAGMWNGCYVVLDTTGLYTCPMDGQQLSTQQITLWYAPNSFPNTDLLTKFMLQNPGTSIITRGNEGDNPLEMLSIASTSQDGGIDIFMLPSYLIDSREIFKRGYAYPLNSEILSTDVLTMYPQVKDYLMRDGALLGYPATIYPDCWTVRPKLLKETQLGDIPETLDDYLTMMLQWYEENYDSHPNYTFDGSTTAQMQWIRTVELIIMQYIRANVPVDGPVSFDTPSFRKALEKLAALAQWKASAGSTSKSEDAPYEPSIFASKANSPFSQSANPESEAEEFILPPSFTQESQPIINASMDYFIVNPRSPHQDAAVKFLEFYSHNMALEVKYMLHPEMNELVERSTYQASAQLYRSSIANDNRMIGVLEAEDQAAADAGRPTTHEAELRFLREERAAEETSFAHEEQWVFSAQTIAQYRKLAPYISFEHGVLIWNIADTLGAVDILTRYFEGTESIARVLSELDRRVAMMYYEGL
ncbi:MAG: ABC transporter substrate-binding protein [Clostridia bacterium]